MDGTSRRDFLKRTAAVGAGLGVPMGMLGGAEGAAAQERRGGGAAGDVLLVNGRIHTFDDHDSVVSSVLIHNGRFVAVGGRGDAPRAPTRVINLRGRTVVPGLIDNHDHIVLLGLRPGFDTRLENAASIADVQATLRQRAREVPAGGILTAIGGWNPAQFAEKRLPVLAELDSAVADHPIYVQVAFTGPSATNSLGKAFFQGKGVPVGADGSIAAGDPALAALNALRATQTFADKQRGTLDALKYGLGFGLTTHYDMGGFVIPGTENQQDSFVADGAASWDPFTAYDAFLELHRRGLLPARLRVFFLSMDTGPGIPLLTQRALNAFREFGDDTMKVAGLGEFITSWPLFGQPDPTNYVDAGRLAASKGWIYQQHSLSLHEDQLAAGMFEAVNAATPIADLHWSVAHVPFIDRPTVNRLKAVGAGLALHGWRYLAGTAAQNGPPYRMIADSGIRAGAGSDSAQISPLNPWLNIYYMVTGKNSSGQLINGGQTLTRAEALRMYTAANGWFAKEEAALGSIEAGKLADLAVLSGDVLDPAAVPDEAIKKLTSVMTIVGGEIVHDAGVVG
jgi:predicted amidohydrolase YtcJ